MNTDFRGRVANTPLRLKHGLLPLFEAIVNSIDAIEQRGSRDGRIVVTVGRDEDEPTEDLHGNVKRSIVDFYVRDNGVGFTEANFASFQTLDTRSKAAQGGKGVGRLLWLRAFSSASIRSRYVESGGPAYLRSFRFLLSDDGVVDAEQQEIDDKPSTVEPETTVHLQGFGDRYREAVPKGGYVIARRIVEHFIEYFVLERAPQIDFADPDDDYFVNLNHVYQEEYLQEANQRHFTVQEHEFLLLDTFLRADGDEKHHLLLCAHNRSVEQINLSHSIPHLNAPLRVKDEAVLYRGFVTANLLDQHVDPQRTGFTLSRRGELPLGGEVTWDDIADAVIPLVREHLEPITAEARQRSWERIRTYVTEHAPRYRPLLKHDRERVENIPADLSDQGVERELHRLYSERKGSLRSAAEKRLQRDQEDPDSFEAFRQERSNIFRQLQELAQADLAEYVLQRKLVLDFLANLLGRQSGGKVAYEKSLHDLFFPRGTTSDDIDYDEHHLWLVDERLAYHTYLASDMPFRRQTGPIKVDSDDRPDLVIFNRAMAFAENADYTSVVIVEFKRPERADFNEKDNPLDQITDYVRQIRAGKARRDDGRTIAVPENTPFYCYAIATLTSQLTALAQYKDFKRTPDGRGFFSFHTGYNAYIELLSYEKLLGDAKKRNRAFFERLGLPGQ